MCLPITSYALGSKGHALVCQLAFEQLEQSQQQKIVRLIANIPIAHQQLINRHLHRKKSTKITYADSCSWADAIRSIEGFKAFAPWHYVNVKRDALTVTTNDCQKNCVVSALLFHKQQYLKQAKLMNLWQQTQALLFLSHWLADIHQPLHVSYLSDLGGNKILVGKNSKGCKNLHQLWDTCLLKQQSLSWEKLLLQLRVKFDFLKNDSLTEQHIFQWANQSLLITRLPSLQYCLLQEDNNFCAQQSTKINFTNHYQQQNWPLLKLQLQHAARRLHLFLKKNI